MTATRRRTAAWVLAVASAVAVVVANVGGLSISDDGIGYLAIADRLLAGKGLGYFLEPKLTTWPPLWPALVAGVAKVTPLGTLGAAVALNAIVAAVTVLLSSALLGRVVRDDRLVLAGTAVAAVGSSTVLFGHILGTDVVFAAAVLGLVLALLRWRDRPTGPNLLLAVVVVWLAFGFRYAAVALVPAGVVWIAAGRAPPRRFVRAVWFGAGASVVPVAWMLRNHAVDGTLLGVRYPSARGVVGNTLDTIASLGTLLVPGVMTESRGLWALVAIVCIAVMAGLCWYLVRRRPSLRSWAGWRDLAAGPSGLLAIIVVLYLGYLVYARSTTAFDRINFRFLVPVYLPLVVLSLVVCDRVIGTRQQPEDATRPAVDRTWGWAANGVVALWASVTLVVGIAMVPYFATGPDLFDGNYDRDAFESVRSSPVLDEVPSGCRVESNLPSALYRSGIEAQWSPLLGPLNSSAHFDDLADLSDEIREHRTCLVWIDLEPHFDNTATLDQIRKVVDLDEVASEGRVTVYVMAPKDG